MWVMLEGRFYNLQHAASVEIEDVNATYNHVRIEWASGRYQSFLFLPRGDGEVVRMKMRGAVFQPE